VQHGATVGSIKILATAIMGVAERLGALDRIASL